MWQCVINQVLRPQPCAQAGGLELAAPTILVGCHHPQAIDQDVLCGVGVAVKRQVARGTQHLACRAKSDLHAAATGPLARAELVEDTHVRNRLELSATGHDGDATGVNLAKRHNGSRVRSN